MPDSHDTLVVGAGFAGSVVERLASQLGQRVLVIDRRGHVGGNTFDYVDGHGVLVHRYGPRIFHTNAGKVVDYLSQFTEWLDYEHRVVAEVDGRLLPIPINRTTINRPYGQRDHPTSTMHVASSTRARGRPLLPEPQRRDPSALPPL